MFFSLEYLCVYFLSDLLILMQLTYCNMYMYVHSTARGVRSEPTSLPVLHAASEPGPPERPGWGQLCFWWIRHPRRYCMNVQLCIINNQSTPAFSRHVLACYVHTNIMQLSCDCMVIMASNFGHIYHNESYTGYRTH